MLRLSAFHRFDVHFHSPDLVPQQAPQHQANQAQYIENEYYENMTPEKQLHVR